MKKIIIFNQEENDLIQYYLEVVKRQRPKVAANIKNNIEVLIKCTDVISQYPPVFGRQYLGGELRSLNTLLKTIYNQEDTGRIMYIPTKAVLGRAFLISKINFLYKLKYLADSISGLKNQIAIILDHITANIFTIMGEEVFYSIAKDKSIPLKIREKAGLRLVNIWEHWVDQGIKDYAPILNSIWAARKTIRPKFGTLIGVSEFYHLSETVDAIWFDFLKKADSKDVFQALEEFIFNLTYEEIEILRKEMKKRKLLSINREDLALILRKDHFYPDFDEADPREMYRFFLRRQNNAEFRRRSGLPGPKITIEKHLICYILSTKRYY